MLLVKFTTDARPHRGMLDVFVNPERVMLVKPNDSVDNRTKITMVGGDYVDVTDWSSDVAKKLEAAMADISK